jgi:SAM-dependent methyltransferase
MKAYFDDFSRDYEKILGRSLSATGETPDYFAKKRVVITKEVLHRCGESPKTAIDFGCGLGTSIPLLRQILYLREVCGIDVSADILAQARQRHPETQFYQPQEFNERVDLVFCNGVFHHIEAAARPTVLAFIKRVLRPGGYFAFWENNPRNPGTKFVMSRCAFDRDAQVLSAQASSRLLSDAGFVIGRRTSAFFFPRALAFLRATEPLLASTMLGGQYLILAEKATQTGDPGLS